MRQAAWISTFLIALPLAACTGDSGGVQSSSMSASAEAVLSDDVYARLADGDIYCDTEYVIRAETASASSYGAESWPSSGDWEEAICANEEMDFVIRMWPSASEFEAALEDCDTKDPSGLIAFGSNWIALSRYGYADLLRRTADAAGEALSGETASLGDMCTDRLDRDTYDAGKVEMVGELIAELQADSNLTDVQAACLRAGFMGFSEDELAAIRSTEGADGFAEELRSRVVDLVTDCVMA